MTSNNNDFLPLIKAKADRWIEAGATGLRRLAEVCSFEVIVVSSVVSHDVIVFR
jgi:hypothetical protein